VGLTDAQIEAFRQDIIATDPAEAAGDYLVFLSAEASALRRLAAMMIYVPNFGPGDGAYSGLQPVSSTAALTTTEDLLRVFETVAAVPVGNPLTQTATIDLRMRRIDVPADWTLEVMPSTVSLAPGQQVTVTVRIQAGTSAVQGTRPRVAVEGYASGQLIGGVAVDVLLPRYAQFDGSVRTFLPMVLR
jgi:hypothetical protein